MQYIFNIGFNRSGTTSLCSALNYLGIPTLHYSYNNKPLLKIVKRNLKLKRKLFKPLDKEYCGFTDFLGENYYEILDKQYPNSKFILTYRNLDDWVKAKMYHENDKDDFESYYFFHRNKARKFFKDSPNRYLEINICDGEGWGTLCPFLDLPIPNIPFPYENKTLYKK